MASPVEENAAIFEGALFRTFRDFESALKKYELETSAIFKFRGGITVKNINAKPETSEKAKYPEEWKYKSVKLQCKHFGFYESRSNGTRKNQKSFATGCTCSFKLAASKKEGGLKVTSCQLEHTGHVLPKTKGKFPLLLGLKKNYVCFLSHAQKS